MTRKHVAGLAAVLVTAVVCASGCIFAITDIPDSKPGYSKAELQDARKEIEALRAQVAKLECQIQDLKKGQESEKAPVPAPAEKH